MHPIDDMITAAEASALHGVNRSTIGRWVKSGRLKPLKTLPGGRYLFSREDVLAVKPIRRWAGHRPDVA